MSPSWLCCAAAAVAVRLGPAPSPASAVARAAASRPRSALVAQVSSAALLKQSEVLELLSEAADPQLAPPGTAAAGATGSPPDIVSLGLVRAVRIGDDSASVTVQVELPREAAEAGAEGRLRAVCTQLLREGLPWAAEVELRFDIAPPPPPPPPPPLQLGDRPDTADDASDAIREMRSESGAEAGVGSVGKIVAVASCKGGVGKSTTAVNLACALAAAGRRVGLVDVDVHGPSLPTMVRAEGELQVDGELLVPLEAHGLKLMSMGFINPGALPLRGAKVTPIVQQLVGRTAWGELDYLIVDMPPGTGDVQLTLSQDFEVSAAVLVTTPQRLSFVDVVKGVEMFDKVGIPTVAVMENMAGLRLDAASERLEAIGAAHSLPPAAMRELRQLLREEQPVFGASHVQRLRDMWGINASFSLPLLPELARAADAGVPSFVSQPEGEAAGVYRQLAAALEGELERLDAAPRPEILYLPGERRIVIALADGTQQSITPLELRRLCRSPANRPDALPADVEPLDFVPTGNYAVSVRWSDGHQSLLPYASFVRGV